MDYTNTNFQQVNDRENELMELDFKLLCIGFGLVSKPTLDMILKITNEM